MTYVVKNIYIFLGLFTILKLNKQVFETVKRMFFFTHSHNFTILSRWVLQNTSATSGNGFLGVLPSCTDFHALLMMSHADFMYFLWDTLWIVKACGFEVKYLFPGFVIKQRQDFQVFLRMNRKEVVVFDLVSGGNVDLNIKGKKSKHVYPSSSALPDII